MVTLAYSWKFGAGLGHIGAFPADDMPQRLQRVNFDASVTANAAFPEDVVGNQAQRVEQILAQGAHA